jgi:tRNA (guanine37-N1)-methyltransferase
MTHFHIVTLFPETLAPYLGASVLGRAIQSKKIKVSLYNPRDFTKDKHKRVDRRPYGGGPGMVLEAEPILRAAEKAVGRKKRVKKIVLSPSGTLFTASYASRLAKKYSDILIVAGHYEGIDARVAKILKAELVSVGSFVTTGGELPALTIVDATARFISGVLGKEESLEEKRIASSEIYTRPEVVTWKKKKYRVPKVLLSGHHAEVERWKEKRRRG